MSPETEPSPDPSQPSQDFKEGVIWNLASIVVLAISGFALNILIGALYSAEVLGVFNQVLATYIFFSMFGVGGINVSTLKLISEKPHDTQWVRAAIRSSLILTATSSLLVTVIFWFSRRTISNLLQSEGVYEGMTWITPGLFLFALNKTMLAAVNGLHRMKAFAVLSALRYLNLLIGFGLAVIFTMPGFHLSFVFSFSEAVLNLVLFVYLRPHILVAAPGWFRWIPKHAAFGAKSMLSGALLELNSRVDVLLVGYYMSDKQTGIYSVAALFFEGLMQLLVTLQHNYNPHISKLITHERWDELAQAFTKGCRLTYRCALILIPAAVLAYPIAIRILFRQPEYAASWLPFSILMAGALAASGYMPFQHILAMGGRPAWHTLFMSMVVLVNFALNLLLIPLLGLAGSATATAVSLVFSVAILTILARRQFGLRLSPL